MTRTHQLYLDGEVTAQGFGQFYKPAEEQLNQLAAELPKLQAEVDFLKVNHLSTDEVLAEARTLYDRWPTMPTDDKRKIAEAIVGKIVIGEGEIDITLSYLPSSEELKKSQQQLTPGEVSQQQLDDAIGSTSSNSNGVETLNMEPNAPPNADDWRALRDKVNELIGALRR